jgi:hypothetical protein
MPIRTLLLIGRIWVNVIIILVRIQIIVAYGKLLEEAVDLCKEGHDDFGNKVVGFTEEGVYTPGVPGTNDTPGPRLANEALE